MKNSFVILLCLLSFQIFAQNTLNQSLGNLSSVSRNQNIFDLKAENGFVSIQVISPTIFRIIVTRNQLTKTFSYAVAGKPVACNMNYKKENDLITIQTDSLVLSIKTKPIRFIFKTPDGQIINEDDESFGTSWIGEEFTTYKKLQKNERFIGLGEKTGDLDRRGSAYTNWNSDVPAYSKTQDPLYGTYPFYIGLHSNLCYGIFLDNTSKTHFNFGASNNRFSSFTTELGEMDYYFIYHKTIPQIIEDYTYLTGRMPLPPVWSLGYQQCRWSYFPDKQVISIAKTFRERQIPCDMIYLDINYMDKYRVFTWDPVNFAKPKEMLDTLKRMGFHTTVIIDPGIAVAKGYKAYEDGVAKNMFIKYPDNTFYTAQVWPGWCHFPDFTKEAARQWWGESFKGLVYDGVEGFWNDMNEIATWGQATPALVEFDYEGQKTCYRQIKNAYGMLMARSTFEGTKKILNGKRPFVLTRSGFSGVQRYSAVWTGDNFASDEHMLLGVRLINSMGITGIPFVGSDIGGFMGEPTGALFTRWITIGAFSPFFRSHTEIAGQSHEPWSFNIFNEEICRKYIQLRYKMLPYIYSLFFESSKSGIAIQKTLAIDYPFDDKIYWSKFQNQYMFGNAFLVAPIESTKEIAKIYLPDGEWYNFHTGKLFEGKQEIAVDCQLDKLPVFIKSGSIIPMQKTVQYTLQKNSDTLEIHIYKGKERNSFVYYEDDGLTYDFEKDTYCKKTITYIPSRNEIQISKKTGTFSSKFKNLKIIFHSFPELDWGVDKNLTVNEKSVKLNPETVYMLSTNENKKSDEWILNSQRVSSITIKNIDEEIRITW